MLNSAPAGVGTPVVRAGMKRPLPSPAGIPEGAVLPPGKRRELSPHDQGSNELPDSSDSHHATPSDTGLSITDIAIVTTIKEANHDAVGAMKSVIEVFGYTDPLKSACCLSQGMKNRRYWMQFGSIGQI